VSEVEVNVSAGKYNVTVVDAVTGEKINSQTINSKSNSLLLKFPQDRVDLAIKIIKK
jgi:hypothetical protein